MIKTLTRHGNSWALILDKPVLELLKITSETLLEVSTDGVRLTISPVEPDSRKKKLRTALEKVNARHGRALKRLAE
jgi:antitoxin component of MazEF toxin-antitoxin module